ncbi:Mycobacterial persistence regulator MprA (Two component response transcriptional regulatory protein) [Acidisarcina polymorpha]|uniref:Mycobacterial persistence regulator MprA (Two component response transcriptional regulatory protein) n=1 Tax=Acidisarcina polymorpha TaxID=2211140 RepID=A0A2Z5FXJ7_9BACT|nr:response regulator transcription factor [Acidisarcina polymorpha]AXC11603.1 Mycobacterial persistence regulator MprA (Two component response transcriptional regulatory protein) [Acidisarcina polymorpha]
MHILIVEDKHSLANMLRTSLEEKGNTVVLAFEGEEGLAHAESGLFDVMVLDIMLPRMDGLEVIRRLRHKGHLLPVLALTARDTVADIVAALDLGIDDYLTKPFAMAEFLARLRAVARKGPAVKHVDLQVGDLVLDPRSGQVRRGDVLLMLTRRQFALLEYLMRRAGHVLTREALLERIWSDNPDVAANTLEVFIRALRTKIDVDREKSLIETVRGVGYRMDSGVQP